MAKTYWLHNATSDFTLGGAFTHELANADPADATDTVTATNMGGTESGYYAEPADTGVTRTSTGTFTVEVNVTTAATNTTAAVQLHRVNSGGTIQASSGFTSEQSTATTGLKTFTHSSPALGTWAANDRLAVQIRVTNNETMGGAAGPVFDTGTANAEVSTPFTDINVVTGTLADTATAADVFSGTVTSAPTLDDLISTLSPTAIFEIEPVRGSVSNIIGLPAGSTITGTLADSATASDTFSSSVVFGGSLSDSANASDVFGSSVVFGGTITDSANATDAFGSSVVFGGTLADSANASDVFSGSLGSITGTLADTATASDSFGSSVVFGGTLADSATASDALNSSVVFGGSLADSATGSDVFSAPVPLVDSIISSISPSYIEEVESVSGGIFNFIQALPDVIITGTVADSATASDTFGSSGTFNVSAPDSATASDAFTSSVVFGGTLTDSANASDVFASSLITQVSLVDSASATDAFVSTLAATGALADTANASDTFGSTLLATGTLSDSATANDVFSGTIAGAISGTLTDSANASDAFGSSVIFNSTLADSATASDAVSSSGVFNVTISDSANASDVFSSPEPGVDSLITNLSATAVIEIEPVRGGIFGWIQQRDPTILTGTVAESGAASDEFHDLTPSEILQAELYPVVQAVDTTEFWIPPQVSTGTLVIDPGSGPWLFIGTLPESATASDSFSVTSTGKGELPLPSGLTVDAEDTTPPYEHVYRSTGAIIISAPPGAISGTLTDSATASDVFSSSVVFTGTLADSANASDTFSGSLGVIQGTLADSANASDAFGASVVLAGTLADSANASDAFGSSVVFNGTLADSAAASDTVGSSAVFTGTTSDSGTASDVFSRTLAGHVEASLSESATASDTFSSSGVFALLSQTPPGGGKHRGHKDDDDLIDKVLRHHEYLDELRKRREKQPLGEELPDKLEAREQPDIKPDKAPREKPLAQKKPFTLDLPFDDFISPKQSSEAIIDMARTSAAARRIDKERREAEEDFFAGFTKEEIIQLIALSID